jgi:hypothetical protein
MNSQSADGTWPPEQLPVTFTCTPVRVYAIEQLTLIPPPLQVPLPTPWPTATVSPGGWPGTDKVLWPLKLQLTDDAVTGLSLAPQPMMVVKVNVCGIGVMVKPGVIVPWPSKSKAFVAVAAVGRRNTPAAKMTRADMTRKLLMLLSRSMWVLRVGERARPGHLRDAPVGHA